MTSNLKIGFDARILVGKGRGMQRATWGLIKGLARQGAENRYYLFSDRPLELPEALPDNFFQIVIPRRKWLPSWANSALVRGANEYEIDVMHFTYNTVWLLKPCLTVVTLHDVISYTHGNEQFKSFKQRVAGIIYMLAMKSRVDQIITDSYAAREEIANHLAIESGKIEVIYNGVDAFFYQRTSSNDLAHIKKEFNIRNEYLFYVGGFEPRKNLERVIDAFVSVLKAGKDDIQLVIAGNYDNSRGWKVKTHVDRLQLGNRIVFTGWVTELQLRSLYQGASVFLFPSRYEGFGLPILEAMASGVPVITSDRSSLREIAGDAAYLVNPEDEESIANAIMIVATDNVLKEDLIAKGLRRLSNFDWDKTAAAVVSIYEKVLRKSNA